MENWKDIKGLEGRYRISDHGRVFSVKLGGVLKPSNSNGYQVCTHNGKHKRIHRLVLEAFVPNPSNHPICNHIDGVKNNNHVSNLEWCTYSHNLLHAFRNGLIRQNHDYHRGEKNHTSKLKPHQVDEIRRTYIPYKMSTYMLGKKYGVSQRSIHDILSGKNWREYKTLT